MCIQHRTFLGSFTAKTKVMWEIHTSTLLHSLLDQLSERTLSVLPPSYVVLCLFPVGWGAHNERERGLSAGLGCASAPHSLSGLCGHSVPHCHAGQCWVLAGRFVLRSCPLLWGLYPDNVPLSYEPCSLPGPQPLCWTRAKTNYSHVKNALQRSLNNGIKMHNRSQGIFYCLLSLLTQPTSLNDSSEPV